MRFRDRLARIFLGLFFLLLAVLFVGDMLDWWRFSLFFNGFWTLFLIVPGIYSLIRDGIRFGNLFLVALGAVFLLNAQGLFSWRFSARWLIAIVLIAAGLAIIAGALSSGRRRYAAYPAPPASGEAPPPSDAAGETAGQAYPPPPRYYGRTDTMDRPSYLAILSGTNVSNISQNLTGGSVAAVLGAADIDLTQAAIHHDVAISVTAIMGGVDIRLPANVRVQVNAVPILGGIDQNRAPLQDPGLPLVTVHAVSIMGGIDIY
ncbi:MAG: LiaF transmembrane domain-containing protein [Christensenellales bacterium]|jgi:hypothetical protein